MVGKKMRAIRIFREEPNGDEKLLAVTEAVDFRAALKYYSRTMVEFGHTDPIIVGNVLTVKDKQGNEKHFIAREAK